MHLAIIMSESTQLCENCQKGNHHSMQEIEDCNCDCSNTIKEEGNLA
jgi:hypothetical protein